MIGGQLMIRIAGYFLMYFAASAFAYGGEDNDLRGNWLTPRMDIANRARADVPGDMNTAPREVWSMETGGEVGYARAVKLRGGKEALLALTGANLELRTWDGAPIWRKTQDDTRQVMHVGDFDGDGSLEVMALCSTRRPTLYDLETGKKRWSWESPPSSAIIRSQFLETKTGIRFITFPTYSVKGFCFDFSGSLDRPVFVWERDYSGKYTSGYGPSILLADMNGDGKKEIVLSSKYPEGKERKTCFHAVLDSGTGVILHEVYSDPDPGAPVDLGRPYGFHKAADLNGDGLPEVVLASCQVEEYLDLAKNAGSRGLESMWGAFVEKDWPVDDRELRPQITSLADVNADGADELVLGLWDAKEWRTAVIDPLKGFSARLASLKGKYFWGCHDVTGDGVPEIIVSDEPKRIPSRVTTIRAFDGASFRERASLSEAAVFSSGDSDLPDDTDFKALRSNPVSVRRADGVSGILVRRFSGGKETGVFLWGGKPGSGVRPYPIDGPGFVRIDYHDGVLLLTDRTGRIRRYDNSLKPVGKMLATSGRTCLPLVWSVGGARELVIPMAGGLIVGGVPDLSGKNGFARRWEVHGTMPALHRDSRGVMRLAAADMEDSDHPAAVVYRAPVSRDRTPVRIPLRHPPYIGMVPFGDDFHLLVNLATGVHTNAFACYDSAGTLLWESNDHGAHPRLPAVADLDGDRSPEIVSDDHGEMRIYNSAGKLIGGDYGKGFIIPAYVLPVIDRFKPGGEIRILGISGFGGISLRTADARLLWKLGGGEYRYYWGLGALGDVDGSGEKRLGIMTEDGHLECIDVEAGKARWSVDLGKEAGVGSAIAGDVNGDGRDEYIAGLPDGRLVAVGERGSAEGGVVWETRFPAAVTNPVFADVDGDGKGELIVSTSDGYVRILK
jgi:hypothetical protein